jgi:NitT/TauT family transport system permease protein
MNGRPSQILYPAVSIAIVAFVLLYTKGEHVTVMASPLSLVAGVLAVAGLIALWQPRWQLLLTGVAAHGAAVWLIDALPQVAGHAGLGTWALVVAAWLTAWAFVQALSAVRGRSAWQNRLVGIAVPLVFGLWVLILWEIVVRGFAIPEILLPAPSVIWRRLVSSVPTLLADFRQTFLKAVLFGYVAGCLAGFVVAILADRVPFLRRGLLPVGNLVSALPIIGIAPVMVMWFGFDWPSKAAVVIVMTFFPMLVNTIAGLAATPAMERDLMRTYAAGYWTTLLKLRLPAALPFIFNALKINSTLALIGAIVAEFFGTPIVGMGFRISTEVGRMGIDMVWAEIAVAALAGSLFYGLVSLVERAVTFWHPSFRT